MAAAQDTPTIQVLQVPLILMARGKIIYKYLVMMRPKQNLVKSICLKKCCQF